MRMNSAHYKVAAFLYMLFLAFVSLRTGDSTPAATFIQHIKQMAHNAAHVPAYALLTFLLIQSFDQLDKRVFFYAAVGSFAYGSLMEVLQCFVPYRYGSFLDISLDTLGIVLSLYFFKRYKLKGLNA